MPLPECILPTGQDGERARENRAREGCRFLSRFNNRRFRNAEVCRLLFDSLGDKATRFRLRSVHKIKAEDKLFAIGANVEAVAVIALIRNESAATKRLPLASMGDGSEGDKGGKEKTHRARLYHATRRKQNTRRP